MIGKLLLLLIGGFSVIMCIYDCFLAPRTQDNLMLMIVTGSTASESAQMLAGLSFSPALAVLFFFNAKSVALVMALVNLVWIGCVYMHRELFAAVLNPQLSLTIIFGFRSTFVLLWLGVYYWSSRKRSSPRCYHWSATALSVVILFSHCAAMMADCLLLSDPPFLRDGSPLSPSSSIFLPQERIAQAFVGLTHAPGFLSMCLALGGVVPLTDAAGVAGTVQLVWTLAQLSNLRYFKLLLGDDNAIIMTALHGLFTLACFSIGVIAGSSATGRNQKKKHRRL